MIKKDELNYKELMKGILNILAYFIGANILSIIFSFFIKKNIIPKSNIYYLLIYLIMAIIFVIIYNKELKKNYKDFKKNYKKDLKIAFNAYLKGIFIMFLSNFILLYVFKLSKSVNELQNIEMIKRTLLYQVIITAILAPLLEEIVFRLSFKNMTKNIMKYSFITGIIFGTAHVITSLSDPKMILLTIPYSAMGVALSYSYKKTNNIFSSIIMHMIHNSATLVIIIIAIKGGII